jgi:hypothetical protein
VATPEESVATVTAPVFEVENVPLAPEAGATKVTEAPMTGVPPA